MKIIKAHSNLTASFQNSIMHDENVVNKAVCKRVETDEGVKYGLVATDSSVYKAELPDPKKNPLNTFIAVHNKKTKEIKLFQVNQASFKNVLYDNNRSMFEQNVVDANKILNKEFSGKKGANAYERKARSTANTSLLESVIESSVDAIATDSLFSKDIFDKTQEERDEFRNSIFPQLKNFSVGKGVRELFDLKNLIGNEMVEHLAEVAVETLNMTVKQFPFQNSYIKATMQEIQNCKAPDSDENIKKASTLIYADALLRMIGESGSRTKFVDAKIISPLSYQLGRDVVKNFTQETQSSSKFSLQKSIIYYTILMLLSTERLEIAFEDILDNVKLSKNELMKYAQIIGCKTKGNRLCLSKANVDSNAKFNVPLHTGGKKRRTQ